MIQYRLHVIALNGDAEDWTEEEKQVIEGWAQAHQPLHDTLLLWKEQYALAERISADWDEAAFQANPEGYEPELILVSPAQHRFRARWASLYPDKQDDAVSWTLTELFQHL